MIDGLCVVQCCSYVFSGCLSAVVFMVILNTGYLFFFVKQKTAYEMRISDWSSDVCSSDLTEAAVDIARLAGLNPAGVICEIMNDDGSMARLPDLIKFAQFHGLRIGAIADLIAYRRRYDRIVEMIGETVLHSRHGDRKSVG